MTSLPSTASCILLLAILAAASDQSMVRIPAGEFPQGRSHALPDDGLPWVPELVQDDRPVRQVRLDAFEIDTHEVTQREYAAFVKATRRKPPHHWKQGQLPESKADLPVANVDWNDASAYCEWAGKRLPTEAEWERAARGPDASPAAYPWGPHEPKKTDACFNTIAGPCKAASLPPNAFGLHDMSGNVWEWTADWYARDYYAIAPTMNPKGPDQGLYRVIRGGSWADVEKHLASSFRGWARPLEKSPNIGFRCAR